MKAIQQIKAILEGAGRRVYYIRDAVFTASWLVQNCEFPAVLLFERRLRQFQHEGVGAWRELCECKMVCVTTTAYEFQTPENDAIQETQTSEALSLCSLLRQSQMFDRFDVGQALAVYDGAVGVLLTGCSVDLTASTLAGECGTPPDAGKIITENGRTDVLGLSWVEVNVQGGTPAVVEPLEVEPTNEAQTFNPPTGVDGFAPVVVGACPVCPAPDVRPLSVVPSRDSQTFSPVGFDGFAPVEVQGYTPNLQSKDVTPTTSAQTVTPDQGYDGLDEVEVDAVTAAIDANITPANIKKDVEILGIVGTLGDYMEWNKAFFESVNFSLTSSYTFSADIENIVDIYGVATAIGNYRFYKGGYKEVNLPPTFSGGIDNYAFSLATSLKVANLGGATSLAGRVFQNDSALETVVGSSISSLGLICFAGCTALKSVEVGALTSMNGNIFYVPMQNLRKFAVGAGTAINLTFGLWTATNVIAEGQSGIDELNYNIKTYLADRVADRTGLSALTVTFGAALYNVLTAETIAAFTAKNWNVASA